MNRVISKTAQAISKIIFILGSKKFLALLERVRSYAWSFSHSDPDPSSVNLIGTSNNDFKKYSVSMIGPTHTAKKIIAIKINYVLKKIQF